MMTIPELIQKIDKMKIDDPLDRNADLILSFKAYVLPKVKPKVFISKKPLLPPVCETNRKVEWYCVFPLSFFDQDDTTDTMELILIEFFRELEAIHPDVIIPKSIHLVEGTIRRYAFV